LTLVAETIFTWVTGNSYVVFCRCVAAVMGF